MVGYSRMLNVLNQCLMRTSPHLLLVEDDFRLRHDLERHLLQRGFAVTACVDGTQGLNALQSQPFDLVLLDIMLPGLDGLSLLETLRTHQNVPVMLMSALGNEQDRISGFTRGADDYLPKPFSLAELDARTDALLRRMAMQAQRPVQTLDSALTYDDEAQDVLHAGHFAGLTGSEFRLLMTLREHGGQALSKAFCISRYCTVFTRGWIGGWMCMCVTCGASSPLSACNICKFNRCAVRATS